MVRVGGGWVALDEFLVKNDPCRGELVILKHFNLFQRRLKIIEECIKRCQEKDKTKDIFNPLKPKSTEGKWSFNSKKIKNKRGWIFKQKKN